MKRAALVTGASAGIGRAIAQVLLHDGYGVTVCSREPQRLKTAVSELGAADRCLAVAADASDEADVSRLLAEHSERWDRLDVLVNNAGSALGGSLSSGEVAQLDRMLSANVRSTWLVTVASIPLLKAAAADAGGALVVNLSSISARYGQELVPAYAAAKAAVLALGQAAHDELCEHGVRVTSLMPGYVDTDLTARLPGNRAQMMRVEDIAEAVRFLTRVSATCAVPELTMLRTLDRPSWTQDKPGWTLPARGARP